VVLEYLTGRALYERVVRDALGGARVAVWIATANLKELLVEAPPGTRARAAGEYVSVLEVFEDLAARGVELRILHAGLPSRAFARELVKRRRLMRPRGALPAALSLRRCPRVHFKAVVVDGTKLYLGSAN
jgi:phosphatidylserine/phosphatidylglycerophosphate/cardiolipin synthase-like enzyme